MYLLTLPRFDLRAARYLHISSLQFEAVGAGACEVFVEIVELLGSEAGSNADTLLASDAIGVAGNGTVVVVGDSSRLRRGLRASLHNEHETIPTGAVFKAQFTPSQARRRSLQSSCDAVGDVTEDCGITISDLALTMRCASPRIIFRLAAWLHGMRGHGVIPFLA